MSRRSVWRWWSGLSAGVLLIGALYVTGCRHAIRVTDRDVARIIAERQREALDYGHPVSLRDAEQAEQDEQRPSGDAYRRAPSPTTTEVPPGFEPMPTPAPDQAAASETARADALNGDAPPDSDAIDPNAADALADSDPSATRGRGTVFTLTDALAYAQQHRREYQEAKEDLYLVTLSLTLERHLWTPQFAAELRTVYGNYGEVRDFDQAMRFVADLSVTQRLPYGGEFAASMVNTLIRDVGRSITGTEQGQAQLSLTIPFLRGAGHVAREDLYQLERNLTYSVRTFERFRRRQLVTVANNYFDLIVTKQQVLNSAVSLRNAKTNLEAARAAYDAGTGTILDIGRAESSYLNQQNRLATARESFRAGADQFKILIGMPVVEPLGMNDLESIEDIENQIVAGSYPLLQHTPAESDEEYAVSIACSLRYDILTVRDQIADAKRGVAISKNAMLPNLDWISSLTYDTDDEHYNVMAFEQARATWRTNLVLSMNDRFRERNQYRASLIDVRRAQRNNVEQEERVRAEVLRTINQIKLQDRLLGIQLRNLEVAADQRDFARIQFEEGLIDNRSLIENEDDYVTAQNAVSQVKSAGWSALLDFRLATETLTVDESGISVEHPAFDMPPRAPARVDDAAPNAGG